MIIELDSLVKKYNPTITGFVHVGGHYGQEYNDYKTFNVPIIFFEPLANNYSVLKTTIGEDTDVITYQCALGNENKLIDMNVETANNGQSSSILKPYSSSCDVGGSISKSNLSNKLASEHPGHHSLPKCTQQNDTFFILLSPLL